MKKILTLSLFALSLLLGSCDKKEEELLVEEEKAALLTSSEFFKQNISIFDARVRSINGSSYVRELYLANFSDKAWDKVSVGFDNQLFEDNGKGNDLKANDGIYTSVLKFEHTKKVPYIQVGLTKSALNAPIVSPEFKHNKELDNLILGYQLKRAESPTSKELPVHGKISCDVRVCSTGCIADWVWDGFGCICLSNCNVEISW